MVCHTLLCLSFCLPLSLGLPLISQPHWVKYGGTNQALTCLLLFLNTLSCSLHHYISSPLPWLQTHSIPALSRLFDLVKGRFFLDRCLTWGLFSSTDAPLSFTFYSGARCLQMLLLWLIDLPLPLFTPFIYLGCVSFWCGYMEVWVNVSRETDLNMTLKMTLSVSLNRKSLQNKFCLTDGFYHGFMWPAVYILTTRCRQISHSNFVIIWAVCEVVQCPLLEKYRGSEEEVLGEPPHTNVCVTDDVRSLSQHRLLTGATSL